MTYRVVEFEYTLTAKWQAKGGVNEAYDKAGEALARAETLSTEHETRLFEVWKMNPRKPMTVIAGYQCGKDVYA